MSEKSEGSTSKRRRRSLWIGGAAACLVVVGLAAATGVFAHLQARLELKDGNRSYLAGRYESAIRHYNAAIQLVPRLAAAYLNRAYSQEALARVAPTLPDKQR